MYKRGWLKRKWSQLQTSESNPHLLPQIDRDHLIDTVTREVIRGRVVSLSKKNCRRNWWCNSKRTLMKLGPLLLHTKCPEIPKTTSTAEVGKFLSEFESYPSFIKDVQTKPAKIFETTWYAMKMEYFTQNSELVRLYVFHHRVRRLILTPSNFPAETKRSIPCII